MMDTQRPFRQLMGRTIGIREQRNAAYNDRIITGIDRIGPATLKLHLSAPLWVCETEGFEASCVIVHDASEGAREWSGIAYARPNDTRSASVVLEIPW